MATPTLETIDRKLEHIVGIFVQLADEQAQWRRESEIRYREADARLTRMEALSAENLVSIQKLADVVSQQNQVASTQADSIRQLYRDAQSQTGLAIA